MSERIDNRRCDVLTSLRRYGDDAFFAMLPFYGTTNKGERESRMRLHGPRRGRVCRSGAVAVMG